MVLTGRAGLTLAGETEDRTLGPGDAVFLPAGCRHRVAWTDPDQQTVWLALFVDAQLCPAVSDAMAEMNIQRRSDPADQPHRDIKT